MKILLINYRYFIAGGAERYFFNVKGLLESRGHEVIPFSIKSKRNVKSEYEKYFAEPLGGQDVPYFDMYNKTPIVMLSVISRLFYSLRVKKALSRLLKEKKPDVAYILHHYNKMSPSIIDACKSVGIPIVIRLSDFFLVCPQAVLWSPTGYCEECVENRSVLPCIRKKCVRNSLGASILKATALFVQYSVLKLYDKVDYFICPTLFMKSKLEQRGINNDIIINIPTFADLNVRFEPNLAHRNQILYFGRFDFDKGVDILLRAYRASTLLEKNIQLTLIGGKIDDVMPIDVSEEEKKWYFNNVRCLPFMDKEKLDIEIQSSVFVVIPSRCIDNLPNALIESYAFLKPVIVPASGSFMENVIDGKTGVLFVSGDHFDLATKMSNLIDDRNKIKEISNNIKEFRNKYSPDKHLEGLIQVFNNAIQ